MKVIAAASSMKILKARDENAGRSKSETTKDTAIAVLMCGLLWVLLYFLFYGTIWVWATSKGVESLLEIHDTIFAFESKFEKAKAFTELTTCLDRSVPRGKVAISDVVLCLRVMGMKSSSDARLVIFFYSVIAK